MKGRETLLRLLLAVLTSFAVGCTATLDKTSVQAREGAPESTQTEVVSIPYNAGLPTYVVAVEPFIFSRTLTEGKNEANLTIQQGGESLAAKLTTALANVGNFSVVDSDGLTKKVGGKYSTHLGKGEVGPFIIKATVTEYTEAAEASHEQSGASLGWLGLIAGVVGAVADKPGLMWTGAGVAAANPSYNNENAEKKGMVTIDFRVLDGRNSRIVGAFKASGTFSSASAKKGFSLFGIGTESSKFAQSVLGQAVRVALNDAVKKISDSIVGKIKA
jgi:curli biogenesis system outer membrane secretion channel CsgG